MPLPHQPDGRRLRPTSTAPGGPVTRRRGCRSPARWLRPTSTILSRRRTHLTVGVTATRLHARGTASALGCTGPPDHNPAVLFRQVGRGEAVPRPYAPG